MDLIARFTGWVDGAKETFFGCRHPNVDHRLELYPDLEYVRYFTECIDCGKEWDE